MDHMQSLWRSKYSGNEHLFIESDGRIYPIVSGGQVVTTTVSIEDGVLDIANRRVSWVLNFSRGGLGLTASDFTPTPSDASVSVGGRDNRYTVTLDLSSSTAQSGTASFVLASNAFSDRVIATNLAGRTSNSVSYSFQTPTTVSIAAGRENEDTRSITWIVTFSDAGSGLAPSDITANTDDAIIRITGTGNTRGIILSFPGTDAISGRATFTIAADAFTDRDITGDEDTRTSPGVNYDFPRITEVVPIVNEVPLTSDLLRIYNVPLQEKQWQVILGYIDITQYVLSISNVQYSLDDGEVYRFRIAEATLVIVNENGEFSPHNDQNIFVQAGYSQYGFRSNIRIRINTGFIFIGDILEINHREEQGEVQIIISDLSIDLNERDVIDYGIDKRIKLLPYNRDLETQDGIYPFPTAVSPPSDNSASGVGSGFNQRLRFQDRLRTESDLDPRNVVIVEDELQTEGAYLREGDDPIIEFKAPYRYTSVQNLVRQLLEHYGITSYKISVPDLMTESPNFESLGRVGYVHEASQRTLGQLANEDEWRWTGYVTDFLLDPNGVKYLPSGIRGIADHQGSLYFITVTGDLYRAFPELRTTQNLGNISTSIDNDPPRGMAAVGSRLFMMTNENIYEIFINSRNDELFVSKMKISGFNVERNGTLGRNKGHAVGMTARRDELFITARQGLYYGTINNDSIELFDGFDYRSTFSLTANANANSVEYLDGRFYIVGGFTVARGGFTLYSWDMEYGITPTNYERRDNFPINSNALGVHDGKLIAVEKDQGYFSYFYGQRGNVVNLLNPTLYFLYSARQSFTLPEILRYQVMNDTQETIYQFNEHTELWKFTTNDFNDFYILGNTAEYANNNPIRAAYNSSSHTGAVPNTNTIWKYTYSTNTRETLVDNTDILRPQLATYYHLGFQGSQNRYGFLPDTRRIIAMDQQDLYYVYGNRNKFGVARRNEDGTKEAVLSANRDNWHNECGCVFTIRDDSIYAFFSFVEDDDPMTASSVMQIVEYSLGQSPRFVRFSEDLLTEGTAYDESVSAVGADPITITSRVTSGTLPTGMTLDGERLHGTPTGIPPEGTRFTIEYTATNRRGTITGSVNFRVKDENAAIPSFGTFTATTLTENSAYDQTITATGSPTPVITSILSTGTLPEGVMLTGPRLHGTPINVDDGGTSFGVFFTATNSEGSDTRIVTFTVNAV